MTDIGNIPLIENAFSGIVITAQTFNPSIFTETWLDKNGIISAQDLVGVKLSSPEMSRFETSEVQIQVTLPKMMITFRIQEGSPNFELPLRIATRTVELLPQTPYIALGLNFDFFTHQPEGQDFTSYNQALFGKDEYSLVNDFSSGNVKYGRYFSKDYNEGRLKLDIKPVTKTSDNRDLLKFGFNFHYEVSKMDLSARSDKLKELISTYDSLFEYALNLVELGTKL